MSRADRKERPEARREDGRMLAGRGCFVADLVGPGTAQVAFVRSTQAHAVIARLDTTEAARQPGVVYVLTGAELARYAKPLQSLHRPDPGFAETMAFVQHEAELPCMAVERVRYVGEPVAAVIAEDRAVAEDAAELIDIDYEPLPVAADAESALQPGTAPIHPGLPDNLAARIEYCFGDVAEARAHAALVVGNEYRMGRHGGVPLECRGVLARPDRRRRRLEVWTSTQIPHQVRTAICTATGWADDTVRVATPDVGGGFGVKANVYGEEVVVAVLAHLLDQEIAWIEDRVEHLTGAAQGRDQRHRTRLAVDTEGRMLSFEDEFVLDVGAASLWTAGIIANTAIHLLGPYRLPAARVSGRAAYTNKTISAQYRGAGRPEACFALERSLDQAAAQLGLDPVEIRRRNLPGREGLPYRRLIPYRDGVPIVYDGGDYRAVLDAAVDALPPEAVEGIRARHPDLLVGYGVAAYIEATGRGPYESARVRLLNSGDFEVAAGSASAGQGHATTLAQVAANALDVDPETVTVWNGDTDAVAHGIGTFGSRSAVLAGSAVHLASQAALRRGQALTATLLGTVPAKIVPVRGGFSLKDTSDHVSWAQLAAELAPLGQLADEPPLEESTVFRPPTVTWTMGAHAAIVTVDPDTGLCRVARYAVAHEGGIDIHPQIVEGQIIGGVAQGLGGALLEEFGYEPDGQPRATSFVEYLLPSTVDVPAIDIRHLHAGTDRNPLGLKGVGESGTIPVYAAVASAIDDALGSTGVGVTVTPITPSAVHQLAHQDAGHAV